MAGFSPQGTSRRAVLEAIGVMTVLAGTNTAPTRAGKTQSGATSNWGQQAKLTAHDGDSGDRFGFSVAVSSDGTTAIVGAQKDDDPYGEKGGSAYVLSKRGGEWSRQAKLTADDGDAGDQFGWSVAVSGEGTTAIVGADEDEDPNGEAAGSAYVFSESDGEWSQQAKLTADDGDSGDSLGSAIALSVDGTTTIVAANEDEDPNGEKAGSAYVFSKSDGEWSQQAKLTAPDGEKEDWFATSVAVSGDGTTAMLGAPQDKVQNDWEAGSVYVFSESGGEWSQQVKLTAPDGDDMDWFGRSVAVSDEGSTAIVGAPIDEDPNGQKAGSAYVFSKRGEEWNHQAKLAADDGDTNDWFGRSVAISGDGTTTIVGAMIDEDPNGTQAGSAYVFSASNGEWSQQAKLAANDGDGYDFFGRSVAVSDEGSTAIVGADEDEDPNGKKSGSAYVFEPIPGNAQTTSTTSRPTTTTAKETTSTTSTSPGSPAQDPTSTTGRTDGTTVSRTAAARDGSDGDASTPGFGVVSVLAGVTGAGYLRWRDASDDTDH